MSSRLPDQQMTGIKITDGRWVRVWEAGVRGVVFVRRDNVDGVVAQDTRMLVNRRLVGPR